jgi:hypothetical protein
MLPRLLSRATTALRSTMRLSWLQRSKVDATSYSEDMQHGRSIGGLAIVNPFVQSSP